jgi:hypothetical protein
MTPEQILADPSKLGMLGMMALALAAFMRGWVITAGHHTQVVTQLKEHCAEVTKEKNEYKDLALRSAETADRALRAAEKVVIKAN